MHPVYPQVVPCDFTPFPFTVTVMKGAVKLVVSMEMSATPRSLVVKLERCAATSTVTCTVLLGMGWSFSSTRST